MALLSSLMLMLALSLGGGNGGQGITILPSSIPPPADAIPMVTAPIPDGTGGTVLETVLVVFHTGHTAVIDFGNNTTTTAVVLPQQPIVNGTDPCLTTSWTDINNVSHTVSTPVPSATPAGITRAISTHQQIVGAMQALYPPRKE